MKTILSEAEKTRRRLVFLGYKYLMGTATEEERREADTLTKSHAPLYKGGNLTLNCGGVGPDDYLFRRLPHGKWTRVIIRHAPNQTLAYNEDIESLKYICSNKDGHHSYIDNAVYYAKHKATVQTLCASDFVRLYP